MAKAGRRVGTPTEWRDGFIRRTREARLRAELELAQIAEMLSSAAGRPISTDTYRKYEQNSMLPHDLVIPFCDLTRTHFFVLFGTNTGRSATESPATKAKKQKAA